MKNWISNLNFRVKLSLIFAFSVATILAVNILLNAMERNLTNRLSDVYESNEVLNRLDSTVSHLQNSLDEYISTRSSDAMGDYYRYEEALREQAGHLNATPTDSEVLLAEKNILGLCESYLSMAEETVTAKRGRNVERYAQLSKDTEVLGKEIHTYIYSLNNKLFKGNSETYTSVNHFIYRVETLSTVILILMIVGSMIAISVGTKVVLQPLRHLADSANEVAEGNFDIETLPVMSHDEVGIVTGAFNKMVDSIKAYIVELRETMERENELKERELMMQSHLKGAQLKYLQAQINPHFLFNTLNAGAQLAMMEEAERTGSLLKHTADFFRYNIRYKEDATIREEVSLVDNYIYICNVRFTGEFVYEKDIDESLYGVRIPAMMLQPLVENAFTYGIRNIDREGHIELSVYPEGDHIIISVWDNGKGMSAERIDEILYAEEVAPDQRSDSSNGVGLRILMEGLRLYYDDRAKLEIISEGEEMGTEILITIPYQKEG